MSKKEKRDPVTPEETAAPEPDTTAEEAVTPPTSEPESAKSVVSEPDEKFLRLAAEYDNFRKRTLKEKEGIYTDAKTDAVTAFLPVYDNLERAIKQETCDEAYRKGVEMTMTGLKEVMAKLGVTEIPALGEHFDPNLHNAVMHIEDETVGEGAIVEVFQTGFKLGDKVIRFAVVKVAN